MLLPYMVEFRILIELRLMGLILRRFKALIEVPSKKMITASIIKHQKLPHLRPKLPMVTVERIIKNTRPIRAQALIL